MPFNQSVFVVLEAPVPVAVVWDVRPLTTDSLVLPDTTLIDSVFKYFTVGLTDFTADWVAGVPNPVNAVTLSPLAETAPPLALALKYLVVAVPIPVATVTSPSEASAARVTVGWAVTLTPVKTVFWSLLFQAAPPPEAVALILVVVGVTAPPLALAVKRLVVTL